MIRFCREPQEPGVHVVDMRVTAQQPFCRLSFDYQHGQIPVLCMTGMYSESVTGIMEGLKMVGRHGMSGHVNVGYFVGAGRERVIKDDEWLTGYHYRGRAVSTLEARRCILIPQYAWVLAHRVGDVVALLRKSAKARTIGLYDGNPSADLTAPEPVSAAALLAAYLTGRLHDFEEGHSCLDH